MQFSFPDTKPSHLATQSKSKKPWQVGKPWCTPATKEKRVLWDSNKKGTYIKLKHGPLEFPGELV